MLFHDNFPQLRNWKIRIVATDVSEKALQAAKDGMYSQFEVQRGVPIRALMKHFQQVGNQWKISDGIKRCVTFRKFNLLSSYAGLGVPFDIIFIRNVMIYFDNKTKMEIFTKLRKVTASDGRLFLGGSETVLGLTNLSTRAETKKNYYMPVK